jgi:hypothetical protein
MVRGRQELHRDTSRRRLCIPSTQGPIANSNPTPTMHGGRNVVLCALLQHHEGSSCYGTQWRIASYTFSATHVASLSRLLRSFVEWEHECKLGELAVFYGHANANANTAPTQTNNKPPTYSTTYLGLPNEQCTVRAQQTHRGGGPWFAWVLTVVQQMGSFQRKIS